MKRTLSICVMLAAVAATISAQDRRLTSANDAAIAGVIDQYEQGLNGGNLDLVLKAFQPNGVWMAPNQPTAKGVQALRRWYLNYWNHTVAKLQFTPERIYAEGHLAYAEVHVTGTTTPKAGGPPRRQDNKGVFVLRQGDDGAWKIDRYILNSNNPAAPVTR